MTRIIVAYEDTGPARTFGPHLLAMACVADRVRCAAYEVAGLFEPIPKNGNVALLELCRRAAAVRGVMPIFALFDQDRLRTLMLQQKLIVEGNDVARMLAKVSAFDYRLRVHALDRNVETLVACTAKLLGEALPKKSINERDLLLGKIAKPSHRALRAQLCNEVSSFAGFVEELASAAVCRAWHVPP